MPLEDDDVVLAGEYVLGTLTAFERAEAERRIGREPDLAGAVLDWEKHFSPLAGAAAPVAPPSHLRRRILAAIDRTGDAAANVIPLRRQLNLWRGLTFAAAALAAALAAFILVRSPAPQLAAGKYVAVLEPQGPGPAFIATIDLVSGTISALRIGAEPLPGKSYELWAVGGGRDKPQSLGLVDASLRIPAGKLGKTDPTILSDTVFAVSLEPQGGSPTGQPTGPVLYTGKLVATE